MNNAIIFIRILIQIYRQQVLKEQMTDNITMIKYEASKIHSDLMNKENQKSDTKWKVLHDK